jgi:TP901 family phage tail tape measure protein
MTVEKLVARVGADITPFSAGMGKVIKAAGAAAIAVAGIAGAAAAVGSKFEFELTKTATVAQAFGKDLEALEKKARSLGATTAFTATQAATGMYDLASAGFDAREIIDATEHAMKLAGATGTEMSQSTQLLAASIKQFGLEAKDAKRVVDTYAGAITSSLFTMEKMTQAMRVAGPVGKVLKWTIEETTGALMMFINQGLTGADAGQKLKISMQFLLKQSTATKKALADLGLTLEDVNPLTHTFGEILETVGMRGMTLQQSLKIFGRFGGPLMTSLAEAGKAAREEYDSFVDTLEEAQEGAGRANMMYERLMNTFRGQWKIVLSASQEVLISLFKTMSEDGVDAFKFMVEQLNSIADWVKNNASEIKSFWSGIGEIIKAFVWTGTAVIKVFGAIAVAVGGIFDAFGLVIRFIKEQINWIDNKLKDIASRIPKVSEGLDAMHGIEGVGPAQELAGSQMAARIARAPQRQVGEDVKGRLAELREINKGRAETRKIEELAAKQAAADAKQLAAQVVKLRRAQIEDVAVAEARASERRRERHKGDMAAHLEAMQDFRDKQIEIMWTTEQAVAQARADASVGVFDRMRSQHELEILMEQQKNDAVIAMLTKAQVDKGIIAQVAADQNVAIKQKELAQEKAIQETKLQIANRIASQMSATADALYQSGVIKGKKAFAALKAIKIVEAVIHTATAIIKTLGEPMLPFPSNVIMAAMIGAMGAAQVYAISQQQPPAYAEGGIVRGRQDGRGRMIRAGEYGDELVVPLRGGKVPVAMVGGGGTGGTQTVERHEHYHFDNATFMDQATLAASMETIAVAGVRKDYRNDGPTRSMIRSRR